MEESNSWKTRVLNLRQRLHEIYEEHPGDDDGSQWEWDIEQGFAFEIAGDYSEIEFDEFGQETEEEIHKGIKENTDGRSMDELNATPSGHPSGHLDNPDSKETKQLEEE